MGSDFNGDGRDDILWRHNSGFMTFWLATPTDNFVRGIFRPVTIDWRAEGTGDFNGDGRDDIVWVLANGDVRMWSGTPFGGIIDLGVQAETGGGWHVQGIGDFDGNGSDDILWRYEDGMLTSSLGDPAFAHSVTLDWQVAGTGDFNGDGFHDLLWRNNNGLLTDWLGSATGKFASNQANLFQAVTSDWHVVDTGDFNGDGRDDILWRNDNGTLTNWLGMADGKFVGNANALLSFASLDWHVVDTGDYNSDGRDDILWRNDSGALTNWLGTPSGGFTTNTTEFFTYVSTDWIVMPNYTGAGEWDY